MDVKSIALREIKPYERNAKKHPGGQIEQIAKSIKEFGFNQPIVLDKDNNIIAGHGRFEAAKLLKLKEVPCLITDLDEIKSKAYRLADNKLNESEWDMDLVIDELKQLEILDFDITIIGFDPAELPLGFEPVSVEEQGQLDQLKLYKCPHCDYEGSANEFTP
jgi:ParB-like chromosome segregation protein Spo0J